MMLLELISLEFLYEQPMQITDLTVEFQETFGLTLQPNVAHGILDSLGRRGYVKVEENLGKSTELWVLTIKGENFLIRLQKSLIRACEKLKHDFKST